MDLSLSLLCSLYRNNRQQWCTWAFPAGTYNSIPPTPNLDYWNTYGAFNMSADHLAFIDGSKSMIPRNFTCFHEEPTTLQSHPSSKAITYPAPTNPTP